MPQPTYIEPGEQRPVTLAAPAGISADLRLRLEDAADVVVVAESGAGISEYAAGNYRKTLTFPTTRGIYYAIWRRVSTGAETAEEFEVTPGGLGPAGAEPGHYVSLDAIRGELDLTALELPDVEAGKLRRSAEALIDNALGPYRVLETGAQGGRKIDETAVDAWRWTNLQQATLVLAARLHRNPELQAPRFSSVSGPEFSMSGPIGQTYGGEVTALLNATGLVIRGARARP